MRVIGIDPGYDRLGVAVMELDNSTEKLLFSHCIESDRSQTLIKRLFCLGQQFSQIIEKHQVDTLAIETLFFNQNKKTVMGVSEVRGMLIYLAQAAHCSVYEFGPQEIKVALTGYGKSDKQAVIDMVKRLIPTAPTKALDDEYDAIAIATTCLAHHGRSGGIKAQ